MNNRTDDSRISGFDLARGLAILGMVLVNFDVVLSYEHRDPDLYARSSAPAPAAPRPCS